MVERSEIVRVARSLLKTPFAHQGRLPGVGIDCIGLITCVARELGIEHQDDTRYTKRPTPGRLDEGLEQSLCVKLDSVDEAQHGDIVTFWITAARLPQHVAIVATDHGRMTMIHTLNRGMQRVLGRRGITGEVVEHTMDRFWHERLAGVWRYRGVTD